MGLYAFACSVGHIDTFSRRQHLRVQGGCGRRDEREESCEHGQAEACVHMECSYLASKSGFEENSQGTRFFNDFRAAVEPYFECEDVFHQANVMQTTKLLLTIDAHSDGVKE